VTEEAPVNPGIFGVFGMFLQTKSKDYFYKQELSGILIGFGLIVWICVN
jgi:hypothetical protein